MHALKLEFNNTFVIFIKSNAKVTDECLYDVNELRNQFEYKKQSKSKRALLALVQVTICQKIIIPFHLSFYCKI